jgi:hypothetical protein
MTELWVLLPAGALLFLPGYTLSLAIPKERMLPFQRLLAAVGLSLALIPLILLFATVSGLHLGGLAVWGLLALCGALSAWWGYKNWRGPRGDLLGWARARPYYPLLLLVFAVSLGVRLYAVRGLSVPLWGDSLNHAWVARLIMERGQVPNSFLPYFDLGSFTYHFGFHSGVAFLQWMTGIPLLRSLLIMGQVLNALGVLTVYLLAHRLTRNHTAALVSALVVGLVSTMPGYYVNWGRYTQLAGQVILPVALFLAMEAVEGRHIGQFAAAAVSAAGLFLTHYRVVLFYLLFLVAYMVYRGLRQRQPRQVIQEWGLVLGFGVSALALTSPWLWNLVNNLPRAWASSPPWPPGAYQQWLAEYNSLGDLSLFLSPPLLALAVVAVVWGTYRREAGVLLLGAWTILLILLANPNLVGLSRIRWVNNFSVLIALYIPASILIGWVTWRVLERIGRLWPRAAYALAAGAVLAGLWGAWGQAHIRNPDYVVVRAADERAMKWITENTSPEANFLVNFNFEYGGKVVTGSDAGWWLSYLTGRRSIIPPIFYGDEISIGNYAGLVNAFARSMREPLAEGDTIVLLREMGATHVYIGERGGFLDPARLAADPSFEPIYRDGRVWVFRIRYGDGGQ